MNSRSPGESRTWTHAVVAAVALVAGVAEVLADPGAVLMVVVVAVVPSSEVAECGVNSGVGGETAKYNPNAGRRQVRG